MAYTLPRQFPSFALVENIAKAGLRAGELTPYTVGWIDEDTNLTVDSTNWCPDKRYSFVYKTGSTGLDNKMFPDQFGLKLPIRVENIERAEKATYAVANKIPEPFIGYWGWDGISNCKTISLDCRQDYGLQITVKGEAIRNTFGRNLTEIIPFTTGCCDDCSLEEQCDKTLDTILKAFNSYQTPATSGYYFQEYVDVHPVKSCCIEEVDPFDKKPYKEWTLTLCNNGSISDLAKIQRFYPDYTITQLDREAPQTTYLICVPAVISEEDQTAIDEASEAVAAADPSSPEYAELVAALEAAEATALANAIEGSKPEDYIQVNEKPLVCDECPDCPDEFTKINSGDKVLVCFDSAEAAGVTTLEEFNEDYYTDEDTASTTIEGLLETAGAVIPGYIAESVKVLGNTCTKLTLEVCVDKGTDLKEHGLVDTTLSVIGECVGRCEGEKTTEWCPGKDKYKINRTVCVTVKKDDCEEGKEINDKDPLVEEVKEALTNAKDIEIDTLVISKQNDCLITFKVDQCNKECLEDGCDWKGDYRATFEEVPTFQGNIWKTCDCEGWTVDDTGCPVCPTNIKVSDCLCGLKFVGKLVTPDKAKPCSFDIRDYFESEPTEVEVTLIKQYGNDDQFCSEDEAPDWTVIQKGKTFSGHGRNYANEEVLARKYDDYPYFDPKQAMGVVYKDAMGADYAVNPNKFYNEVRLYVKRDLSRTYHKTDAQRRHRITMITDSDNVSLFEELKTFLNKTLLSNGACKLL